ncbi:unnamed protein product [Caenorhabditis brenneri]
MSLSRPAKFPLLKLPFLCIDCVIKSWDILDIIFFALFSKRTRQIVKHLKIALNRIEISLSDLTYIKLDKQNHVLISPKDWKSFVMTSYKQLFTSKEEIFCFTYGITNELSNNTIPPKPRHQALMC